MTKNKKITCLDCFLTLKFNLEGLNFKSECLLNHKHQYETLEYFLLDKIKEEDYICLDTNHNNLLDFVKNVIKIFVLNALRIMKNMKMI
jgi:hypothetical protein